MSAIEMPCAVSSFVELHLNAMLHISYKIYILNISHKKTLVKNHWLLAKSRVAQFSAFSLLEKVN